MGFKTKTDYYGLTSSLSNLVLIGTTENKSAQTAEAQNEDGFVVANVVYGEKKAPACDYAVKGNVNINSFTFGTIKTIDTKSFVMTDMTITTGAGQSPTVAASGQLVEDGAVAACTTTLPNIALSGLHHAQTFGAFTLGGQGAHLTQCSLNATCQVSTAEKDGDIIAHDITDGRLTVTGTVVVSDSTYPAPTITASSGWIVTSPLTESNPNSDFPSYTFTLTKYLTAD